MTLGRFLPIEFVRALGRATAHQHSENMVAEMEGKASPRQRVLNRSNNYMLEAIERDKNHGDGVVVSVVDEDGVLRVKIVVRKKVLGMINGGGSDYNHLRSSLEERLHLFPRKQFFRCNAFVKNVRHGWSPDLQSIPEE